jgi:hypothetical protein
MKLRITTLIIIEEGQVQDIYHSLEDDQDKAYQEIIDQVNQIPITTQTQVQPSTSTYVPKTN